MQLGFVLIFAIVIGGGIGVLVGAFLLYVASDELRWSNFLAWFEDRLDNRLTRRLFDTAVGRWINFKTLEAYIRAGKPEKAQALAVREGLVDEAIGLFEDAGRFREGAVLARKLGRDGAADALFRRAIEDADAEDKPVIAAELAEEAGYWEEAVNRLTALESRASRLRAARISAEHDMAERAVALYLEEEAILDGLRVAEQFGMVEFLLAFCEKSDNAILHHFAADAARRAGDAERGIAILERNGLLHDAALFAREAGLEDKARALMELSRQRKAERRLAAGPDPFEAPIPAPAPDGPAPSDPFWKASEGLSLEDALERLRFAGEAESVEVTAREAGAGSPAQDTPAGDEDPPAEEPEPGDEGDLRLEA